MTVLFLVALLASSEYYEYCSNPACHRLGQNAWLILAIMQVGSGGVRFWSKVVRFNSGSGNAEELKKLCRDVGNRPSLDTGALSPILRGLWATYLKPSAPSCLPSSYTYQVFRLPGIDRMLSCTRHFRVK